MEWKEVRLGDIADVQTGPFGSQLHKSDYIAEGIPCIMPTNIGPHLNFIVDGIAHVSEVDANRLSRHLTEIGDIIYARRGDIEKCAYVTTNEEKWLCGTGCLKIRCNNEVNSRFIAYLLSTAECKKWITGNAVGTTMLNLSKGILSNLPLLVPSHEDQRRIASILSSLDRKIELNNKINADLEEMAQAIFKNWFVDFEPFKDGKFVDSELGKIPEGWKVGCLGDMGAVVCGKTPSKSNSNYYGGDIPFIKIPDMHGNVFVENSEDRLTEEGSLSQIKKLIPPYSLMVSCIATVGLVSINTKPSHTNQQINTVIPHNKSALFYLYQHIKNNEEFLKNMGRGGTTTLNVNTKSFSNISLLIPSEIALEQFHGIVEGLFKKIEQNLHESRTLSLLRDTLLPRLMSGELEVPE